MGCIPCDLLAAKPDQGALWNGPNEKPRKHALAGLGWIQSQAWLDDSRALSCRFLFLES